MATPERNHQPDPQANTPPVDHPIITWEGIVALAREVAFQRAQHEFEYGTGRVDYTRQELKMDREKLPVISDEDVMIKPGVRETLAQAGVETLPFTLLRVEGSNSFFKIMIATSLLPIKRLEGVVSPWVEPTLDMINEVATEVSPEIAQRILALFIAWEDATGFKLKWTGVIGR